MMMGNKKKSWNPRGKKWTNPSQHQSDYQYDDEYGQSPPTVGCFNRSRFSVLKRNQQGGEASGRGDERRGLSALAVVRRTITNGSNRKDEYKPTGKRREEFRPTHTWSKVKVINGISLGKDFVINSLNDYLDTGIPIRPAMLQYSPDEGSLIFYLEDKETADSVRAASRRISGPNGQNVILNVHPSAPPFPPLTSAQEDIIKVVLNSRYHVATASLNLSDFVHDQEFQQRNIFDMGINRSAVMYSVAKLIIAHCPQVNSIDLSNNKLKFLDTLALLSYCDIPVNKLVLTKNFIENKRELEKLDRFQLTELDIDENPMCSGYQDPQIYIKMARNIFPKLVKLDGTDIGVPIGFADVNSEKEVGKEAKLPPFKGSHFVCEDNRILLTKFITEYFAVFDSESREPLLNAYDSDAVMTLSAVCLDLQANQSRPQTWSSYVREGHNIKCIEMWERNRKRLFRRGKLAVTSFLQELPKTKHDLSTFIVDVSFCTPSMLSFVISGLFIDGENCDNSNYSGPMMHFTRTFVVVATPGGISVINEQLFITPMTVEQNKAHRNLIQKSLVADQFTNVPSTSTQAPVAVVNPQTLTPAIRAEMVSKFSAESGMYPDWAERCLDQNNFDYNKSAQVFMDLKNSGGIPREAFMVGSST